MKTSKAKGRIRKARTEDIDDIYQWLCQQDKTDDDGSFLCNWNMTLDSFHKNELIVFVEQSSLKAVAYQWGALTQPGILDVRPDMRYKGIGKRLVEYRIKQARKKGVCALGIRCKPSTSISFWERMGFSVVPGGMNYAYQILEYDLPVPEEGRIVDIQIGLYPESRKLYENTLPVQQICQQGKIVNNQIVYLSRRVCIPFLQEIWKWDAVVEVIVDGKLLYRDKAKYGEARKLGVKEKSNSYSIDQIYLPE